MAGPDLVNLPALALQLHSSFQMCALCGGLMGPSPRRPGDDMSRFNAPLREPGGDAADFLHGPADQGFGFAGASVAADFFSDRGWRGDGSSPAWRTPASPARRGG